MDRTKKILISMLVLGALAAVGAGTYATFNATTVNSGNSFSTGTLLLSNQVPSGVACLSTSGAGATINAANSAACGALFTLDLNRPGSQGYAPLIIKNTGSLAASSLTVAAGACAQAQRPGETSFGTAIDFCSKLDGTVTEITGQLVQTATTALVSGTAYTTITVTALPAAVGSGVAVNLVSPTGSVQTATTSAAAAAAATSLTVTSFTANANYPTGSSLYVGTAACVYPTVAAGLCTPNDSFTVTTSTANGLAAVTPPTLGALGAAASGTDIRYFLFGVSLQAGANNSYQGLKATFPLTWVIQ